MVRKGKITANKKCLPEIQKELDTNKMELEKQLENVEDNLGMRKKVLPPPRPPSPVENNSSTSSSSSDSSSSDSDSSSSSDEE